MKTRSGERRVRYGTLPRPSDQVEVPYAQCRDELAGMSYGQLTKLILDSQAWQDVMVPILDALDTAKGKRGKGRSYTAHELESALLFQRVAGERGYRAARNLLAGDRHGDARRLLGFAHDRGIRPTRGEAPRWLRFGIPSESTVCRHKRRFGLKQRRDAYATLLKRLREEIAPLLGDDARILYVDGTKVETHYTPPKTTPKRARPKGSNWKRVVNRTRRNRHGEIVPAITAPDAGYIGRSNAPPEKSGAGWNLIPLVTEEGVPLAHRLVPLHKHEGRSSIRVIEEFDREIRPLLPAGQTRVVTTDSAHLGDDERAAWRAAGIIENTHFASHADRDTSKQHAQDLREKRYRIDGYPNWYADGHRQLHCKCEHRKRNPSKPSLTCVTSLDRNGRGRIRTEGSCARCGTITITAERWRRVQNVRGASPDGNPWDGGYVRCVRPEDFTRADLAFGNALTFDDPKAAIYGSRRFGHNEGFNGQLTTRFEHLKGKRWFRLRAEAELDTNIVFSIMTALALEQKRRAATNTPVQIGPASGAPPPLKLAA